MRKLVVLAFALVAWPEAAIVLPTVEAPGHARGRVPIGIYRREGLLAPAEAAQDEQKRAMTPADAARPGSNFIVVGRPILRAPSPADAATRILRELGR